MLGVTVAFEEVPGIEVPGVDVAGIDVVVVKHCGPKVVTEVGVTTALDPEVVVVTPLVEALDGAEVVVVVVVGHGGRDVAVDAVDGDDEVGRARGLVVVGKRRSCTGGGAVVDVATGAVVASGVGRTRSYRSQSTTKLTISTRVERRIFRWNGSWMWWPARGIGKA